MVELHGARHISKWTIVLTDGSANRVATVAGEESGDNERIVSSRHTKENVKHGERSHGHTGTLSIMSTRWSIESLPHAAVSREKTLNELEHAEL